MRTDGAENAVAILVDPIHAFSNADLLPAKHAALRPLQAAAHVHAVLRLRGAAAVAHAVLVEDVTSGHRR